jgi:anaerobic magnesium-protoporphyrin IX monomethyl ester cyclase
MPKVALVIPPVEVVAQRRAIEPIPHLGIGYIAAYLSHRGIECTIIDGVGQRFSIAQVAQRVVENVGPGAMVGITAKTHEIHQAARVAGAVKELLPDATTVIGGPHAIALPRETLRDFPSFDIACCGEGEQTFFELVGALTRGETGFHDIQGIAWRNGEDIFVNHPREWISNLDQLPFPAWDLFPHYQSFSTYPIMSARGCPYACIFCMRVLGGRHRARSARNVVEELGWLVERFNAKFVAFEDDTFTLDVKRLNRILDRIMEAGLHRRIKWQANARANVADYGLFRKMREAGCVSVGLGIESGNAQVLRRIKKGITLSAAEMAVRLAKKAGLETRCFYIIGHPHETRKTAWDTIKFAARLNSDHAAFGLMVPYPKTEVAEMAKRGEGSYRIVSSHWSDYDKYLGNALELEQLSRRQLQVLQAQAYLFFYLRNFRVFALLRHVWENRLSLFPLMKKLLKA